MSALEDAWISYGGTLPRGDFDGEQNARCPIHEDGNASARVNLAKGLWFCNVCGFGGDVYRLIMAMEGVEFKEAKHLASHRFGEEGEPARTGSRPGRKGGSWRPSWL